LDWLENKSEAGAKIGVAASGRRPIALYATALDPRIKSRLVQRLFRIRVERVWEEPIYGMFRICFRNLATPNWPASSRRAALIVNRATYLKWMPTQAARWRGGAAPGKWGSPDFNSVEAEVARANALVQRLAFPLN